MQAACELISVYGCQETCIQFAHVIETSQQERERAHVAAADFPDLCQGDRERGSLATQSTRLLLERAEEEALQTMANRFAVFTIAKDYKEHECTCFEVDELVVS